MAVNPLDTINKKVVEQEKPAWLGVTPNYSPGRQTQDTGTQESSWTAAERARLNAINAQKKGTLNALKQSEKNVGREFQTGQQTLSGQYQAGKRSLAEYLAQRGQLSSGAAAQGQIQGLSALSTGLGTLEATRQQSLANIEQQRAEAQQLALQQQAELAGESEQARAEQDLAAIQAGAYNQDVQAEINRRKAINPNDPTIPFLQAQRNQKLSGIATSQAEQAQQEFENNLALQKLALSRASGGGGSSASGMTDEQYQKFAIQQATASGVFNQDTYDQLMALRNAPASAIQGSTVPSYSNIPTANEDTQALNAVAQFSGGRISYANLQRQLQGLGYRYNPTTKSVDPI